MWQFALALAVALAALLLAEYRGSVVGVWIAKPAASTIFVAAAVWRGALGTRYGHAVLAALVLCWLGDVLLIPRGRATFLAGLASFLLGHIAYCAAFLVRGTSATATAVVLVVLGLAAIPVGRWLLPHVRGGMRRAVLAYMAVITVMVALAAGTWAEAGNALLPASALGFYLSDLSVARDRFVQREFLNRAWGLPLYYFAQLLLATQS